MTIVLQLIELPSGNVLGLVDDNGVYDFRNRNRTIGIMPVAGAARYDIVINGTLKRTESHAPYHLAGDMVPWVPTPGENIVQITAFGSTPVPLANRTLKLVASSGATQPPTPPSQPTPDADEAAARALDLKPPTPRGPANIRNQDELDALAAKNVRAGQLAIIAPGEYTLHEQIIVYEGGVLAAAGPGVSLTWAGQANDNASVIRLNGTSAKCEGLKLACGGCDAFSVVGNDGVINGNEVHGCADFLNLNNSNTKRLAVANNVVPLVANYFVYSSGRKSRGVEGIIVDPVEQLTITGNTASASTWMHILRAHATYRLVVRGNTLTRRVARGMHDGTVGKMHDGGDFLFEYNTLIGTDDAREPQPGFLGIGPLGGGDGGLKETDAAERAYKLALQLDGFIFRRNVLRDVHVVFFPGIQRLDFHDNKLTPARGGLVLDYKPAQTFKNPNGTTNPGDYRQWRGEVAGRVYNNVAASSAPGVKLDAKHWQNMPSGVAVTHNTVEGQVVNG